MERILLIDGENFKGKIKEVFKLAGKPRPVWHEYDFKGLLEKVLSTEVDNKIFYFARITEHPESLDKSKDLIKEQRLLLTHLKKQGFETLLAGRVQGFLSGTKMVFKEKGVDVRIAVDMVTAACAGSVKEILLGSSDSDLQPAIREVRSRDIHCTYLGFETKPNKGMTYTTNKTILIRDAEVIQFEKVGKL